MLLKIKIILSTLAVVGTTLVTGGTAAADGNYCAGGDNIYAYGNWDCGTPNGYSPWSNIREHDENSFRRITFDVRQGTHAGRFEVQPGDVPPGTTAERAEVYGLPGAAATEGDVRYYAFSISFGADWKTTGLATIVSQWRAAGVATGSPPVAVYTPSDNSDRMRLHLRTGDCTDGSCEYNVGHTIMTGDEFRATRGIWHDFILYVDWSATDGRVQMWHRPEGAGVTKIIDVANIPTLNVLDGEVGIAYPKFGIYRMGPQPFTHVLYNDSYCVARLYTAATTCLPE